MHRQQQRPRLSEETGATYLLPPPLLEAPLGLCLARSGLVAGRIGGLVLGRGRGLAALLERCGGGALVAGGEVLLEVGLGLGFLLLGLGDLGALEAQAAADGCVLVRGHVGEGASEDRKYDGMRGRRCAAMRRTHVSESYFLRDANDYVSRWEMDVNRVDQSETRTGSCRPMGAKPAWAQGAIRGRYSTSHRAGGRVDRGAAWLLRVLGFWLLSAALLSGLSHSTPERDLNDDPFFLYGIPTVSHPRIEAGTCLFYSVQLQFHEYPTPLST